VIIGWFSGGATSAVACKLALESNPDVQLMYIETGSHHPDANRFLADCERWYERNIKILRSDKYTDVFDVIKRTRYLNGPTGARCTAELKRKIREKFERENEVKGHVWGFEQKECLIDILTSSIFFL